MLAPDLCQQNSDDKTPCRATKKGLPFCTHVYIAGNSWNKWRVLVETRIEMGWMDEMGVVHCHVWLPGRVARSGWMIPTCSTCGSLIHWITRMGVNKKTPIWKWFIPFMVIWGMVQTALFYQHYQKARTKTQSWSHWPGTFLYKYHISSVSSQEWGHGRYENSGCGTAMFLLNPWLYGLMSDIHDTYNYIYIYTYRHNTYIFSSKYRCCQLST